MGHHHLPSSTSPSRSTLLFITIFYHSFLYPPTSPPPLTLLFPPSPLMLPFLFITSVAPLRAASNSVCLRPRPHYPEILMDRHTHQIHVVHHYMSESLLPK